MHDWPALAASLSATLATTVAAEPSARVHGGCINESYRWDSAAGPFFVKIAAPTDSMPWKPKQPDSMSWLAPKQ
jgi:fructosamine-3-kinase